MNRSPAWSRKRRHPAAWWLGTEPVTRDRPLALAPSCSGRRSWWTRRRSWWSGTRRHLPAAAGSSASHAGCWILVVRCPGSW